VALEQLERLRYGRRFRIRERRGLHPLLLAASMPDNRSDLQEAPCRSPD
jgi:hypothetical protein